MAERASERSLIAKYATLEGEGYRTTALTVCR